MPTPALQIAKLHKNYGHTPALIDINLEVAIGSCFGLIGANGAGKTTLLKCLLDFCDVDAGEINIFGQSHKLTQARQQVSYLPERFIPPHYLTGTDFLQYMTALHEQVYDPALVDSQLDALGLERTALKRPVRSFSKGMTQKLGLAACLLAAKDLLILDEPTSGLDPLARSYCKHALATQKQAGRTLIMSTHALLDVAQLCDNMAVMEQGRLCFIGSPAAFLQQYQTDDLELAYLTCIGATRSIDTIQSSA